MSKYNNIVNKHTGKYVVSQEMFFEDIPSDMPQETREDIAKGIIIISNKVGSEGIYILNNNQEVISVCSSSSSGIPSDIITIIENAIISANSYTNIVSGNITNYIIDNYATSADVYNSLTILENSLSVLSGETIAISGNVVNYIDDKLSNVYTYKGSVTTFENLPISGNTGDVYNVISGNGQVGDIDYVPAGTNYAWVGASGTTAGHWDPLGGIIDLSLYATSADVESLESKITVLDNKYGAFSASMTNVYVPKINSALQSFKLTGTSATTTGNQSSQYGAVANYTAEGNATLDLSNLVIDCGDF